MTRTLTPAADPLSETVDVAYDQLGNIVSKSDVGFMAMAAIFGDLAP